MNVWTHNIWRNNDAKDHHKACGEDGVCNYGCAFADEYGDNAAQCCVNENDVGKFQCHCDVWG